jgi:hypothetical protein
MNALAKTVPRIPVEYETALRSLTACVTLDESRYWSDKADALAAWARIYHSNETLIEAKRLKLHAFRRMGQLAAELRPQVRRAKGRGKAPGPVSLLIESGLKRSEAVAARRLALLTDNDFAPVLERPRGPTTVVTKIGATPIWREFLQVASGFRSFTRRCSAERLAITAKENAKHITVARRLVPEITVWLDALKQHLE